VRKSKKPRKRDRGMKAKKRMKEKRIRMAREKESGLTITREGRRRREKKDN